MGANLVITSLLLISNQNIDIEFAKEIANLTKLEFHHATSAQQGAQFLSQSDQLMLIFTDASTQELYDQFETAIQESVGLFSDKLDANRIYFLSTEPLSTANYLIQSPIFGNFVMRNYRSPHEGAAHYSQIIRATLEERAFGLEKFMRPGCKVQTAQLIASGQKKSALDAIKNYLLAAKFQNRIAASIANAVDEILVNAIFTAPVDGTGRATHINTPRNTPIKLEGKSAVEIQIGYDGNHVGITIVDHWGSLDKMKLLNHLSKVYNQEEYKLKAGATGAGIGLSRILQSSGGGLFFASESGARTEVTLFFENSVSFLEFKNQFRFISTQFYF